ncbi:MAG: hypothetical protein RQ741_03555 [Wenzhouxiangellaceae bacterium]|nr:hypothetical protein [Wenzhouxiangellaceae bacterium]
MTEADAGFLALVRSPPGSAAANRALEAVSRHQREGRHCVVFFHGPGVDQAAGRPAGDWAALTDRRHGQAGGDIHDRFNADRADAQREKDPAAPPRGDSQLLVCNTSWRRRHEVAPLAPFVPTSLVALFSALDRPVCAQGFGLGAAPSGSIHGSALERRVPERQRGLLIEVGFAPTGRHDRIETLELALGAAALELDARVLFHGPGRSHLEGSQASAWRQLTDFGFIDLLADGSAVETDSGARVQCLEASEVEHLRTQAGILLAL